MEAMAWISETLGRLWRSEVPEQQRVAAKRGKEAFFEPLMVMWPERVEGPLILKMGSCLVGCGRLEKCVP